MITFVGFDQSTPGGGQKLVINFTIGLFQQGITCKIYCGKSSHVYKELSSRNIDFIHVDSDIIDYRNLSNHIAVTDIVVLMYFSIKILSGLEKNNPKILFYSIFPEIFKSYSSFFGFSLKKNLLNLVNSLNKGGALNFMDFSNYNYLSKNHNFTTNNVSFIPVPIVGQEEVMYNAYPRKVNLKITYIGRGDEKWKIFPVVKIIQDLSDINLNFEFHIITTTTELYKKLLDPLLIENKKISIKYKLGLSGASLTNYLIVNSDLHFSMGTAALEASVLGIPTVLVDYSHDYFPDSYRYRWIYEDNSFYNLGFLIDNLNKDFIGAQMCEIIGVLSDEKKLKEISSKCYDYSVQNHSLGASVNFLIAASKATNYRSNDLIKNSVYLRIKKIILKIQQVLTLKKVKGF